MSDTIANSRALLRLFSQSDYGELHVRSGDFEMFVARAGGRRNPMRDAVLAPAPAPAPAARAAFLVTAPHIASLVSTLPVGSVVAAGDKVARIALLDEAIDIVADQAGTIDTLLAQPGALIEYATPLLSLTSAA
jgi:acetyl-CoA carboxylase biotin carboxyl carrier protein